MNKQCAHSPWFHRHNLKHIFLLRVRDKQKTSAQMVSLKDILSLKWAPHKPKWTTALFTCITGIYKCTNLPTHKSCASLCQTPSVVQTIVVGSIVALYFSSQENEHRSPMCLRQFGVRWPFFIEDGHILTKTEHQNFLEKCDILMIVWQNINLSDLRPPLYGRNIADTA